MRIPIPKAKITSALWGPLDEVILTGHENGELCQWDIKVVNPKNVAPNKIRQGLRNNLHQSGVNLYQSNIFS